MRILLLHDKGTATGGSEHQILALRRGLRERGHDARLLSSRATPVPGSEVLADYACFGADPPFQVLSQVANPSAYRTLRRVLRDFRPDVVHLRLFMWQLSPLVLPLLRDVPCLYQTSMYKPICPLGTKLLPDGRPCGDPAGLACLGNGCLSPQAWGPMMLQRALWQRWRHVIDQVVALSTRMKRRLEAEGVGPVEVVPNGVPERPARPPLAGPPTVAYAGRLSPEKGVDALLEALARVAQTVPDVRLLIAGQGPEEDALRAAARRLGLDGRVVWLGHLARDAMEGHFEEAWVQAVPSRWEEPFGNVSTEAMMRGTAVIASAVGGQTDIVEDGVTGALVPPDDVDALAAALMPLLQDRERAEQAGQAGRRRALAHFSEARCVEHFLRIYERLRAEAPAAMPA